MTQPPIIGQVKRLLIGTPAGDTVQTKTAHHLNGLAMHCQASGLSVGFCPSIGTYVDQNQNAIVEAALQVKADAVMLIDSDMEFPPTILQKLLARNRPVVGAVYRSRSGAHEFAAMKLDGSRPDGGETGCQEVDFVASGMMLIRASVLRSMSYPWFFLTYGEKPVDFAGNDVNFCRKARVAGHKVFADYDAGREIGHISSRTLGWVL